MIHILDLPKETIVHIFTYYIASSSQGCFYFSVSKVCEEWNDICKDSIFWRKFDGSIPMIHLTQLCESGILVNADELVFSRCSNLKYNNTLRKIFSGLPNLKSIDLSQVKKIEDKVLICLGESCKNLKEIKFSKDLDFPLYRISSKLLDGFLSAFGQNLTIIDLSNSDISDFSNLLTAIAASCCNLEQLLIQIIKLKSSMFPLASFQKGCSKIKVLRLGFPITFSQHQVHTLPGLPALEIFTHPNREENRFTDKDIRGLISNSPNLKVLDIRGCKSISPNCILSLPATHVENLYISETELHFTVKLREILTKWIASLTVLDISRTRSACINEVLNDVVSNGKMKNLRHLDVSHTRINKGTVINIIDNCDKLNSLDLELCRSIGRGYMQLHQGRVALRKLHTHLLCHTEQDSSTTFAA